MTSTPHQYIDRRTGNVRTERLFGDGLVGFLYSRIRENAPRMFRLLTSRSSSSLIGYLQYESILGARMRSNRTWMRAWGVNPDECLDPIDQLDTPGKLFSRKLRYHEYRPMPNGSGVVVSPCDSRVMLGSFRETSMLCLKDKFFDFEELFGPAGTSWRKAFESGDFAIFRLTPDMYHYNHAPVSGQVMDYYELTGDYHSCNPSAVLELVTPYSKNKRTVTIIDTDVPDGTGVGLVAMIEVVALMIGRIVQCYSAVNYDDPQPIRPRMFLAKGQPKSCFLPGSSTVVLVFQPDRVQFDDDLLINQYRAGVTSRLSLGFGQPLVETELRVRSSIARAND